MFSLRNKKNFSLIIPVTPSYLEHCVMFFQPDSIVGQTLAHLIPILTEQCTGEGLTISQREVVKTLKVNCLLYNSDFFTEN